MKLAVLELDGSGGPALMVAMGGAESAEASAGSATIASNAMSSARLNAPPPQ
jgi:hypothetical protein